MAGVTAGALRRLAGTRLVHKWLQKIWGPKLCLSSKVMKRVMYYWLYEGKWWVASEAEAYDG